MGDSVKTEVKFFFQTRKVPPWLNKTLIALIPKKLGPKTINHFRLISLCNTSYKVVSKILVLRMKHLMPILVSPSQAAFVTGRRGSDNVIVAQELLYAMESMKGRIGYMIIKINLEKAYDRLEWGFVRNMLLSLNFHLDTMELIMSCISFTSVSLLFNGEQLEEFQPSRGLRQGDPISPYIFILCMEFLSSLINKKCNDDVWDRIKASRNGPGFSHIFFVDDLLLFGKATQENCEAISEVLEEFCSTTGQKISCEKSKVFFSPAVTAEDRADLTHQLGISETNNLGNYLGFPLWHKGRNMNEFLFVIDRVQAKLAGWKANCLSPAGRLVLLKAAVTPIVEYYMQCCKLLARVSERIGKLTRDFLWGSNDERRRLHLVGWEKVTNPPCIGGLSLFQVKARNDAILAKFFWLIASNPNVAWSRMLYSKYLTPARLSARGRKYPASRTWKACKVRGVIFNKGLK